MFEAFQSMERRVRLYSDYLDLWIKLLQASACSHYRSSGPDTCNQVSDSAVSLLPNLNPGCLVVSSPVGFIRVLVSVEIFVRVLSVKLSCLTHCSIRALEWISVYQLDTVSAKNSLSLFVHVLRNGE